MMLWLADSICIYLIYTVIIKNKFASQLNSACDNDVSATMRLNRI